MTSDTRYDTRWDGTDSETGTWFSNAYSAITRWAETTVQDLRAFMEAFDSYDQIQEHLADIKEMQRKRTIQDNRYKHIRYGVKSDYTAIYRHQAR